MLNAILCGAATGFFEDDRHRPAEPEPVRRPRDRSPCSISRQPSWPGLLQPPPECSPSSDSDVDTVQEKERERQLMLLKRLERRKHGSNTSLDRNQTSTDRRKEFRARSRSPLAFSQSIDVAPSHTPPQRRYQRCSSSRSLSTAIFLDDTISSSTSSESIPSSLNEDEPITIRSAHSCNTIHLSSSSFASPTESTKGSSRKLTQQLSQQSTDSGGGKRRSKGLKERLLLKMKTQSHSLPASPQLPDEHQVSAFTT